MRFFDRVVHGRVGRKRTLKAFGGEADDMNKEVDDGEQQGCKGLARMIKKKKPTEPR